MNSLFSYKEKAFLMKMKDYYKIFTFFSFKFKKSC